MRAGGCPVVAALCQSTDWQLKLRALGSIPSDSSHLTCCLLLVSLGVGSGNETDSSSQTCMVCIKKNVNHPGHPE